MIKGITIQLLEQTQVGVDWANHPIYQEIPVNVDNVLVGEPSTEDAAQALDLYGKHVQYVLGIPKGDDHDWIDKRVILPEPFAGTYNTIGFPVAGIENMVPLQWNKKVKVERYVEESGD